MLENVRNAFKIKEIRDRLFFTLLMLVVVRIGTELPLPGVDGKVFSDTKHFGNIGRNNVRDESVEYVLDVLIKELS